MAREGRLVAGRYRLGRRVGDGGMGVVWQATDLRLDRLVAVKQLRLAPGLTDVEAEQARQRVLREARIAARLQHPHAVALYDVATDGDDGAPWLVLEYLPSRTLAEHGRLPPERVAEIGAQVAAALAAAHAAGIVHRDVKPANILLAEDGTAKITDFGIAHATGDVTVTRTGMLAGTPAYLSPEAARGQPTGPASDVFSLGATLYAAVDGAPPFGESGNPIAQLHRVAAGHVPPPRHAGPLTDVLLHMLRDDPAARPAMAHLADTLAALASGRPPAVVPSTRLDPHPLTTTRPDPTVVARSPRRPHLLVGVLAAGLLALLFAVLLTTAANRPEPGGAGTASPGSSTSSPLDPAQARQAVTDYYALLPDRPDEAWLRLGPDLRQAQNREQYEELWKDVKDLHVLAPPQVSGTTATVQIEYTRESRGQIRETHQLGLLRTDDTVLINADRVLSSHTTPGGDNEDNGGTDGKKGKDDERHGEGEGDSGGN